jgi:hypothetical protein
MKYLIYEIEKVKFSCSYDCLFQTNALLNDCFIIDVDMIVKFYILMDMLVKNHFYCFFYVSVSKVIFYLFSIYDPNESDINLNVNININVHYALCHSSSMIFIERE